MSGQEIERTEPCPRCGTPCVHWYSETVFAERYRFSYGYRCHACGAMAEGDGYTLPDDLRALFLAAGEWQVSLAARTGGDDVMPRVRALRELYGLGPVEAVAVAKRPPAPLRTGTAAEMEYERLRLARFGVRAVVERA